MATTANFEDVYRARYHCWGSRCDGAYGSQEKWSNMYNGTDSDSYKTTCSDVVCTSFHDTLSGWLNRVIVGFNTSAIPDDAVISQVVVKGNYRWYHCAASRGDELSTTAKFMRASSPPSGIFDIGDPSPCSSAWQYLRDLDIYLGEQYVEVDPTFTFKPLSVTLNSYGIASINKSGYTYIAIIDNDDTPIYPTYGRWGFDFEDLSLDITYGTSEDLTVVTLQPTDIDTASLTMNGEITQGAATKRGFDYGSASGELDNEWYEEGTYGKGTFEKEITNLTPGQDFCYKAKAC